MTIRLPPPNILDRILALLGKERRIILPHQASTNCNQNSKNPYVTRKARKENFFKALFRRNN